MFTGVKHNRFDIITGGVPAIISGLLLTASFPKIGLAPLAWLALVPLLFSVRNQGPENGFRLGLLAGFVHFVTLLYWLVHTMRVYGYLPLYLSVIILVLFAAFLALFVAFFTTLLVRLAGRPTVCVVLIPVLWAAQEYVRSFLFSGFPWELLGHSQYLSLRVIQVADILGVYGVSFCLAAANAFVFMALLAIGRKTWQKRPVGWRPAVGAAVLFGLVFSGVWGYGGWRLPSIDRQIRSADSVRVSVVQGNIDQTRKWDRRFQHETIGRYLSQSLSLKDKRPELIVWPETATPFYFLHHSALTSEVKRGIRQAGTDFLIGSPSFSPGEEGMHYYNSAYLIGPEGKVAGRYDKVHLVPFGEYVPFKRWLPFLGKIVAEVGDFKSGRRGNTLAWQDRKIGTLICFEMIFPNLSRALSQGGAAFLVNMTNDAWFGRSAGPYQHFSMAVFRSVENRKALVRAANTGISGFIDPAGRIVSATPLCEPAVMTRPVALVDERTVYMRHGDFFAQICLAVTLVLLLGNVVKARFMAKAD